MPQPQEFIGGGYRVWLAQPPADWRPDSPASVPPLARLVEPLHVSPFESCHDASLVVLGFNTCILIAKRPEGASLPGWAILDPVDQSAPRVDPNAN